MPGSPSDATVWLLHSEDPLLTGTPGVFELLPEVGTVAFLAVTVLGSLTVAALLAGGRAGHRRAAVGVAIVVYLAHVGLLDCVNEDAFIIYRHAEHWAAGHGPTWNVGERVEGTSTLLWTGVLAILSRLGMPVPESARLVGIMLGASTLPLVAVLARYVLRRAAWTPLAALVLALDPYFASHTAGGMETALFSLLLAAGYASLLGGRLLVASGLLGLATLTRPDGGVLWLAGAAWALLFSAKGQRMGRAFGLGLPFVVIVGASVVARLVWNGEWLPNSVVAKSGVSLAKALDGLRYLWRFADLHLLVPLALAAAAGAWWSRSDRARIERAGLLAVGASAYAGAVILSGGDWMPGYRYVLPILVLLAPLVVFAVSELSEILAGDGAGRPTVRVLGAAGVTILALVWTQDSLRWHATGFPYAPSARGHLRPLLDGWKGRQLDLSRLGLWLRAALPPDATVACLSAGALPYHAGLPSIDMRGLSDPHIARAPAVHSWPGHARRDDPYVFLRRPDVIYLGNGFFQSEDDGLQGKSPLRRVAAADFYAVYDRVVLDVPFPDAAAPGGSTLERTVLYVRRERSELMRGILTHAELAARETLTPASGDERSSRWDSERELSGDV